MASVNTRITDGTAIVAVGGRFDFSAHQDFRREAKSALENSAVRAIHIDLGGVDYIDSSALGMLLLTRENVLAAKKSIVLLSPSKIVQQVLDVANFQKLFDIR